MPTYAGVCNLDKSFYSIKEFAEKLSVSTDTIRRSIKKGHILAFRIGSSSRSHLRIPHSEITRIATFDLKKVIKKMVESREWENL